jgi:hypothetical protein
MIYDELTFGFCSEWNAQKKELVSTKVLSDVLFLRQFFLKCLATFLGNRKGPVLNCVALNSVSGRAGMKYTEMVNPRQYTKNNQARLHAHLISKKT